VDVAIQHFHPISDTAIDALIQEGDVFYCAGGFLVESGNIIHTHFIEHIVPFLSERQGDEDSIIGMPIQLLNKLISQVIETS
jgi:septum formation protein